MSGLYDMYRLYNYKMLYDSGITLYVADIIIQQNEKMNCSEFPNSSFSYAIKSSIICFKHKTNSKRHIFILLLFVYILYSWYNYKCQYKNVEKLRIRM